MRKGAFFSLTLFLFCLSFFPPAARADSLIARFVFVTEPQSVPAGERSGACTVQAQNAVGNSQQSEETIDLVFSSTSASGEFLGETGDPVRTVMNKGTANRTFYYRDSSLGTHTLTVAAVGRISGKSWTVSQQITIESAGSAALPAVVLPAASIPPGFGVVSPAPSTPGIEARAGSDRTVVAGASVDFAGTAIGLLGIPIDNARFWWNFGDGATAEGIRVSHAFRAPGTYMVGLHVSSGAYAGSDYATITVVPNKVEVVEVVGGEAGFIRLRNGSEALVDIGGWIMEADGGARFILPAHTMIRGKSDAAFLHTITGFSRATALTVRFPDGSVAFRYSPEPAAPLPLSLPPRNNTVSAPITAFGVVSVAKQKYAEPASDTEPARESTPSPAAARVSSSLPYSASGFAGSSPAGSLFLALAALLSAGASAAFLFLKKFIA